jgi:ATP-dependent Lon protease
MATDMHAEPSRTPASGAALDERRESETPPASSAPSRSGAGTRPLPDDALIVLPVRNIVVFPATVLPIAIGRERSQQAVQEAVRLEKPIGVLLQSRPDVDEPGPDDLHWVATSAAVLRYVTAPDGSHQLVLHGEQRFRIAGFYEGTPFLVARVELLGDPTAITKDIEARMLP